MNILISVHDKTNLADFALTLKKMGHTIIATSNTYKFLNEAGIKAIKIEEWTKYPEILNGRVKTLNPVIFGGILAKTDQLDELEKLKIDKIDMIVCNLYPFWEVKEDDKLVENIDIGGVSLIRAAAKNFERVTAVVDIEDYAKIIKTLKSDQFIPEDLRKELALKAFAYTSKYDSIIYNRFWRLFKNTDFPDTLLIWAEKQQELRYGENPHQKAVYYVTEKPWFEQLHGKELSFNNILDMDTAVNLTFEFKEPTVSIIKHTVPCGVAVGETIKDAYMRAYESDPESAYGSVICLNRNLDIETAQELKKLFTEIIIAPSFSDESLEFLKKSKKNTRIIKIKSIPLRDKDLKKVNGGYLYQDSDTKILDTFKVVSENKPANEEIEDLEFAWKVVRYVRSNAIVVAKKGQVIGVGGGQTSRIEAMKIALKKAGVKAENAVLASDAYFPFRDNIDEAAHYKISAIIQPGGSIRDREIIAAANENKISLVFTGYRVFKH
jgi:phosphoribosylaminoimidazolecarboxamide formyltransferase/IMP cyclohydrolase